MKAVAATLLLSLAAVPVQAAEPDNLVLPPGFHASVVAEGLGAARHIAVRDNGDIYVSTTKPRDGAALGIIALRLDRDHKVIATEHFSTVAGGTGLRIHDNALYAASPTTVTRFAFQGPALVPGEGEILIDGMPATGFPSRGLAFDDRGGLYVTVGASSNICLDPAAPKSAPPAGLKPCPSLETRSGVWRFDARKRDQKFPTDGEQIATGLRDMMAVDWSKELKGFYGVMQARNDHIDTVAEELHRVEKGANLGWPYTYYDNALHARVIAPEYGGDGKTVADGNYDVPLAGLPAHQSPLDLVFYDGRQFPKAYRGGAFVVYHGGAGALLEQGHRGYDVVFLPFSRDGHPGQPQSFIEGFAGPNPGDRNPGKALYRPTGVAVAPDGSLYIVEGEKGRLWRIAYDGKG